jgi:hypothetical protein
VPIERGSRCFWGEQDPEYSLNLERGGRRSRRSAIKELSCSPGAAQVHITHGAPGPASFMLVPIRPWCAAFLSGAQNSTTA